MNKSFYVLNRKQLIANIKDHQFAIMLYSGDEKIKSEDENYDFQVDNDFYYLTGISQANVYLLLLVNEDAYDEFLFIQENDEDEIQWVGEKLYKNQASALSGIRQANIYYLTELEDFIKVNLKDYPKIYLKTSAEHSKINSLLPKTIKLLDIKEEITKLRIVKKSCEIKKLKIAIKNTNDAILKMMENCKSGLYEYQLEAFFDFSLKNAGQKELSFKSIVASGKNATTLHYSENNSLLKDGDLILIDLGCKEEGYCADISRTFPVNGKFTPLQKKIYNIVLKANKEVIKHAKANMTIEELQKITTDVMAKECLKKKLIQNYDEIHQHFYHSVSHSIGLDTHDPSFRKLPLPINCVISNEPGLYFKEYGIGIRIEDDLLIKENKAINLSKKIIKSIKDIETFMQKHAKS